MRVERGGRLVENDEARGRVRDREGARDLDHLLSADGQVLNQIAWPYAVAGKDLVELVENEPPCPAPPTEALDRRVNDARVFGDRQVRAERQFLKDAAKAERSCARRSPVRLFLAVDDEFAAIRRDAAVEDMHQRRLAGAVVADDADALAGDKRKIGAVQSPDGAVGFFDADEIDERSARVRHGLVCLLRGRLSVGLTSCWP